MTIGYLLRYWSVRDNLPTSELLTNNDIIPKLLETFQLKEFYPRGPSEELMDKLIEEYTNKPSNTKNITDKIVDILPSTKTLRMIATCLGLFTIIISAISIVYVTNKLIPVDVEENVATSDQFVITTNDSDTENKSNRLNDRRLISHSPQQLILSDVDYKDPQRYGMSEKVEKFIEDDITSLLDIKDGTGNKIDNIFQLINDSKDKQKTAQSTYNRIKKQIQYKRDRDGITAFDEKLVDILEDEISFCRDVNIEEFYVNNPSDKSVQLLYTIYELFNDAREHDDLSTPYLELISYMIKLECDITVNN